MRGGALHSSHLLDPLHLHYYHYIEIFNSTRHIDT